MNEKMSHEAIQRANIPESGNCKGQGTLSRLNMFEEQLAFVVVSKKTRGRTI